jgi:hypothetical protein
MGIASLLVAVLAIWRPDLVVRRSGTKRRLLVYLAAAVALGVSFGILVEKVWPFTLLVSE